MVENQNCCDDQASEEKPPEASAPIVQEPKSVAQLQERFVTQAVSNNVETNNNSRDAFTNTEQRQQHVIDKKCVCGGEWSGSVFDIPGISLAFCRCKMAEDFKKAVTDVKKPGVSGDLIATQIQGDYLATMERAFRTKHMTRVRCAMHAAARHNGMGHDTGIFKRGLEGYVTGILKQAKGV